MAEPRRKQYGGGRPRPRLPLVVEKDGRLLGKRVFVWFEPAQYDRIVAIADYEERTQSQVVRTLLWLGLGVYERLAGNLAGRESLADTPLANREAPSPFPSILRWFTDQEFGRAILDNEAHDIVLRERRKTLPRETTRTTGSPCRLRVRKRGIDRMDLSPAIATDQGVSSLSWAATPTHTEPERTETSDDAAELPIPALHPRGARVLISPIEAEQTRDSGLFLPQNVQRRSNEGIVRAIGPGYDEGLDTQRPVPDLEVGDRVLYLRWAGFEVSVDGERFVSVYETDIVAVADEGAVIALGGDGVRE